MIEQHRHIKMKKTNTDNLRAYLKSFAERFVSDKNKANEIISTVSCLSDDEVVILSNNFIDETCELLYEMIICEKG